MHLPSVWLCLMALYCIRPTSAGGGVGKQMMDMEARRQNVESSQTHEDDSEIIVKHVRDVTKNIKPERVVMAKRVRTSTMDTDNEGHGINAYIRVGGSGIVANVPRKLNYDRIICIEMTKEVEEDYTDVFDMLKVETFHVIGDLNNLRAGPLIEIHKFDPVIAGQKFFSCVTEDDPVVLLRFDRVFVINQPVTSLTFSNDISMQFFEVDLPWSRPTPPTKQKNRMKEIWSGLGKQWKWGLVRKPESESNPEPQPESKSKSEYQTDPEPEPKTLPGSDKPVKKGMAFIVREFKIFEGDKTTTGKQKQVDPGREDEYPEIKNVWVPEMRNIYKKNKEML